ncbi:hypothetical protein AA0121_g12769 [Alternaria tenuissima]|nr:hypothetical protein AA0121_g12769 [Alternaria tenuissima]
MVARKSYTSSRKKSGRNVSVGVLAAIVIIPVFLVLVVPAIYFIWRRIQRRRQNPDTFNSVRAEGNELHQQYYMPPPPPAQLGMRQQQSYQTGH